MDYNPTFKNINKLFVISFQNGDDDPTRNSIDKHYMPIIEIKDFNAGIDNKQFFDQPVKNKQEACEELVEMSRNNDYTIGNLLDYLYHQNYYLVGLDLSRQTNVSILQINFTGKSKEEKDTTMLFLAEKQQKTILNFSFDSLIVTKYYRQWNIQEHWMYKMSQVILNVPAETGTLSIINQMQFIV